MEMASFATEQELDRELAVLSRHFDVARLVNPISTTILSCEFNTCDECFDVWDKSERCRNCVSSRVLATGETAHKLERIGDDIYLVISQRIGTAHGPCVLEMVSRMEPRFEEHYAAQQQEFSTLEELSVMAFQDPLTGIFNRRYAEENLAGLARAAREDGDELLLALVDIDQLKDVNDTWGHFAGDCLICAVVFQVLQAVEIAGEKQGFFARTGGDEFLLAYRCSGRQEAQSVLRGVIDSIDGTTIPRFPQVNVSASIGGMLVVEEQATSMEGAMAMADRRLYAAKKAQRGTFVMDDEHDYQPPEPCEGEKRQYRRDTPFTRQ